VICFLILLLSFLFFFFSFFFSFLSPRLALLRSSFGTPQIGLGVFLLIMALTVCLGSYGQQPREQAGKLAADLLAIAQGTSSEQPPSRNITKEIPPPEAARLMQLYKLAKRVWPPEVGNASSRDHLRIVRHAARDFFALKDQALALPESIKNMSMVARWATGFYMSEQVLGVARSAPTPSSSPVAFYTNVAETVVFSICLLASVGLMALAINKRNYIEGVILFLSVLVAIGCLCALCRCVIFFFAARLAGPLDIASVSKRRGKPQKKSFCNVCLS
jgi:hypothetical protein